AGLIFLGNNFAILLQYVALHQHAVYHNASLKFLYSCKRERMFPSFIANRFTQLPYQNNRDVQSNILNLKTALLNAAIAERRRQKSFCIRGITVHRNRLRSELSPELWQRMSSENQRICSRLREDQNRHFDRKLNLLRSHPRTYQQPRWFEGNIIPPTRHVVIGTNEVDSDMAAVLNLGPSFAITPRVNTTVIDSALCGIYQFAYQLRWRTHRGPTVLDQHDTLMSLMPFKGKFIQIPPSSTDLDARIADLEHNIQRIYRNAMDEPYHSNLTSAERRGVKKILQSKRTLRYTVGDKCGSFVVMPQSLDKALTANVLSDTSVYEETTPSAFEIAWKKVKSVITSIVKKRMSSEMAKRLHGMVPTVPTLYNLVKTHKIPSTADTVSLQLMHDTNSGVIREACTIGDCPRSSLRLSVTFVSVTKVPTYFLPFKYSLQPLQISSASMILLLFIVASAQALPYYSPYPQVSSDSVDATKTVGASLSVIEPK
ncbi:hypothetical protein OSTOST_16849, partial [Ostertagia ostertagi]